MELTRDKKIQLLSKIFIDNDDVINDVSLGDVIDFVENGYKYTPGQELKIKINKLGYCLPEGTEFELGSRYKNSVEAVFNIKHLKTGAEAQVHLGQVVRFITEIILDNTIDDYMIYHKNHPIDVVNIDGSYIVKEKTAVEKRFHRALIASIYI